jgi:hypothetical protein
MEVPSAMLKDSIPTLIGGWRWGTKNWLHVFVFTLTGLWLAGEHLLQNRCCRGERVRVCLPTTPHRAATVPTNPITTKPWIVSVSPILQHVSYLSWLLTLMLCNRFDLRVARQQLCKHGPTRNNRWGCFLCRPCRAAVGTGFSVTSC